MRVTTIIVAAALSLCTITGIAGAAEKPYQTLYKQGVAANKRGDLDQAISLYSKALTMKKDSADLYFVRGRAYKQKDQYDNAIRDFDKAIELRPGYADAFNHRGVTYIGKGDLTRARADFQKACQLGSGDGCANVKKLSGGR